MKIFKFGGGILKDGASIKKIIHVLNHYKNEKILIVVSAVGKTTNALEDLTNSYFFQKKDILEKIEKIKMNHHEIIQELFIDKNHKIYNEVNNTFVEIDWIIEEKPQESYDYLYDQIVSIGELISSRIVSAYLNETGFENQWIDARNCIQTDNNYREARVNWQKTEKSINQNFLPILKKQHIVTQGFIGCTSENFTTTLGREGSDFSAAIFASCLNADSVTIWKDVPGVLNADPKFFENTVKYEHLPYDETIEMAYYGASVIHPKTIQPLQNKNIPLFVKPFLNPQESGTVINKDCADIIYIPTIIIKENQTLITISTIDFSFITEHNLSEIFNIISRNNVKINMMQNSAISFSICVEYNPAKAANLVKELKNNFNVQWNKNLKLLTIRHYNEGIINKQTKDKEILLEQKTRNTIQLVLK